MNYFCGTRDYLLSVKSIRKRRFLIRAERGTVKPNNERFYLPRRYGNSKIYIKEPPYNETSIFRANNFFQSLGPSLYGGSPVWRRRELKKGTDYDVDERSNFSRFSSFLTYLTGS